MAAISILGSSVGALAAAARLSVKGHRVTIIEESHVVAPDLSNLPNRLTLPAAFRDLFLKTGDALEVHLTLNECDNAYSLELSAVSIFEMPGFGVSASSRAIAQALGNDAAHEWDAYMREAARSWEKLHKHVEHYDEFVRALNLMSRKPWWRRSAKTLNNPKLIAIRDASPFHTTPSVFDDAMPYIASTFGVYSVNGGLHELRQALQKRCEQLKVEIRCDSPIDITRLSYDILVLATPSNAATNLLAQIGRPCAYVPFDMKTNKSNIYVVGEQTFPGSTLPFAALSGAMLANLIGTA